MTRSTLHRLRELVMDDFDDAMLSFALRDRFPEVLFLRGGRPPTAPQLQTAETILAADPTKVDILFPTPGWQPVLEPDQRGSFCHIVNPSYSKIFYNRTKWFWGTRWSPEAKWAFSMPTPTPGRMDAPFDREAPEKKQLIREVWKILDRLMTNRLKAWHPATGTLYAADTKGGSFGPVITSWRGARKIHHA